MFLRKLLKEASFNSEMKEDKSKPVCCLFQVEFLFPRSVIKKQTSSFLLKKLQEFRNQDIFFKKGA